MSRYRYRHNDNIIDIKVSNHVKDIHDDYYNNHQKTLRTITTSILDNIKRLFLNMDQPSFQNRQADKILSSSDYNNNLKEIDNDIHNCYQQLNTLQKINRENNNYNNIYNDFITTAAKNLDHKTEVINDYILNPIENNVIIHEDFQEINHFSKHSNALIDINDGTVKLDYGNLEDNIDVDTKIYIMEGSNGFPGNMHKVKKQGQGNQELIGQIQVGTEQFNAIDSDQRRIKFYSEEDPKLYTANIIDGNDETWFEYELCNIPENKKQDPCNGYGFEYDDGTVWAKEPSDGFLKLHLKVVLPEPILSNNISITPHQLIANDAGEVVINKVKIAAKENDQLKSIYEIDKNKKAKTSFDLGEEVVQEIHIFFEQHSPYDAEIGHIFYERITKIKTTKTSWFGFKKTSSTDTSSRRIDGPNQNLDGIMAESNTSLSEIILSGGAGGVAGYLALGAVLGPLGSVVVGLVGGLLQKIWGGTEKGVVKDIVQSGVESFPGWRWAIGVRNIKLNSLTYKKEQQVITKSFDMPGNVDRIRVESTEFIPDEFTRLAKHGWVKYYFSLNDNNWYQISPYNLNKNDDIPSVYIINSEEFDDLRIENYEYIDVDFDPDKINFKIELTRPDDLEMENSNRFTPEVSDFKADIIISQS